jgi:sodium/hydrogen antiporter
VTAVLTIAVVLIVYSAASGPLGRAGVTSAMAFVVAGLCTGASGLGWLDVPLESAVVERVTELALAFLLFSDSARIDVGSLRHSLGWPSRLLLIGLPLTLVAGLGAGLLVFPGMAATSAFLLSTMLCSTDAALGQRVVEDPAVPPRVRQALDVESGLNDGVAVPFFLVALDVSLATLVGGVPSAVISNIASQIGWGVLAGMGAGAVGGAVFRRSMERGWLQAQWVRHSPWQSSWVPTRQQGRWGAAGSSPRSWAGWRSVGCRETSAYAAPTLPRKLVASWPR